MQWKGKLRTRRAPALASQSSPAHETRRTRGGPELAATWHSPRATSRGMTPRTRATGLLPSKLHLVIFIHGTLLSWLIESFCANPPRRRNRKQRRARDARLASRARPQAWQWHYIKAWPRDLSSPERQTRLTHTTRTPKPHPIHLHGEAWATRAKKKSSAKQRRRFVLWSLWFFF